MLELLNPVKWLIITTFASLSVTAADVTFIPHDNWLAQNVEFEEIAVLKAQIEKIEKLEIKNRGEAHITTITPPEFEILAQKLSILKINELAFKAKIQTLPFKKICIGRGQSQKNQTQKTYFVVIKSEGLFNLRRKIQKDFEKLGGKGFDAEHFYPHITVGFTQSDLHENDGVIKNEKSCIQNL